MKTYLEPDKSIWNEISKRPTTTFDDIEGLVKEVFADIGRQGDEAVRRYTQKFDGIHLQNFKVTSIEIQQASSSISEALKTAMKLAYNNIHKFHAAQQPQKVEVETAIGVRCWQEARPIDRVGLYIPGGTAPLFSTLLMLAVPARLAGCREIVLCSPPDKNGEIHPAILYAAQLCGVSQIFKIGGVQAIATMAQGTETVPAVYKIFGPGNQFVTVAKQYATRLGIAIDMPAGPSEVLVVADDTAQPEFIAADLLSQAEHGKDSQVVLVTTSPDLPEKVNKAVWQQLQVLPRKEIAQAALKHAVAVYFSDKNSALNFINNYAPEHFIVQTQDTDFYVNGIRNAGSVFIGAFTPESAGDYASGTNHTLPTNAYARQYSGVNLESFLKKITFQHISLSGLQAIGPAIEVMAEAEGLVAHKNAVRIRLNN